MNGPLYLLAFLFKALHIPLTQCSLPAGNSFIETFLFCYLLPLARPTLTKPLRSKLRSGLSLSLLSELVQLFSYKFMFLYSAVILLVARNNPINCSGNKGVHDPIHFNHTQFQCHILGPYFYSMSVQFIFKLVYSRIIQCNSYFFKQEILESMNF